ncbi:ArsR/SmtB family transcription factor [Streptomyces bluensis]|uniref:ArsR/SmtB family transcription factor n=1 Tax=Streptomyces bluensis TaxID=33897 RepID=UPI0033326236
MARYFAQPDVDEIEILDVMKALSDEVRMRLISVLADGEYHACRPEEFDIGVQKSTLSHHFKVLRKAGLTMTRLEGRNHQVRLRREDLAQRFPGLLDSVIAALPNAPDGATH